MQKFYIQGEDPDSREVWALTEDGDIELVDEEEWVTEGEPFDYGEKSWTDGSWQTKGER